MIAPTTHAVAETFSAEKMYGSAAGTRSFQRIVQRLAAIRAHQLDRAAVGREQAAQRVDRHREERQVRGDHRDGEPGRDVEAAEVDDDHRRDREDRHGLRRDDVGEEPALQDLRLRHEDAEREAERRAEREPDGGLLRREERGVEELHDQDAPKPEVGCSKSARTIVLTCGIDVSSTTNGHVQPALIQTQR